jgi:hypothetical protein
MRVMLLAATLALAAAPAMAQGSNNVRGHFRSDGTYVAPHYRTNPDNSTYNNWSTKPNVNPYTGAQGARTPSNSGYSAPRSSYGSSYGSSYKNSYGSTGQRQRQLGNQGGF